MLVKNQMQSRKLILSGWSAALASSYKPISAAWLIYNAHIGRLNATFLTANSRAEACRW